MLDTITSSDSPIAASHAAKTSRIMGSMLASVKWVLRIIIVPMIKRVNIIPSRHRREDIRCDRYISNPRSATVNARPILIWTRDI